MPAVLARFLPPPVRLTQRWAKRSKGQRQLFAWEAVPPEGYVSLGMLCSTTPNAPPREAIRCVPAAWVVPATTPPRKVRHNSLLVALHVRASALPERSARRLAQVWDDSGSSGAQGSIWLVNRLNLIAVTPGHEPPTGPFYDLKAR